WSIHPQGSGSIRGGQWHFNHNLSLHKLRASLASPILIRKICCLAQIRCPAAPLTLYAALQHLKLHFYNLKPPLVCRDEQRGPLAVAGAAALFPSLIVIIIILQITASPSTLREMDIGGPLIPAF